MLKNDNCLSFVDLKIYTVIFSCLDYCSALYLSHYIIFVTTFVTGFESVDLLKRSKFIFKQIMTAVVSQTIQSIWTSIIVLCSFFVCFLELDMLILKSG